MLTGNDSDDEAVPDMMKLEGHSDDDSAEDEKTDTQEL